MTMRFSDFLSPDQIRVDIGVSSKKKLLEALAVDLADNSGLAVKRVYKKLCDRERLGSTALGRGVALPHARIGENFPASAVFWRLEHSVSFDSPDDQSVDLVFALVVPDSMNDGHLQMLAEVAEMCADDNFRASLRGASGGEAYELLSSWQTSGQTG